MTNRPFVHLHCHSHYSRLDGASRIPDLITKCRDLGMSAIAVTDHGNLYGAMELLREAEKGGIQPIVGIEVYVAPGDRRQKQTGGVSGRETAFHLTLLAINGAGFRNLMRLSSKAFLEGYYYNPRIDKQILEQHSEGLICLSGCVSSEFSDFLLHDRLDDAISLCHWYEQVFGDRFYVEVQDNGIDIQRTHAAAATDLANRVGLPLVGTSDAHYLNRTDCEAHDVLLCISTGKDRDDPGRLRFDTDQFHVRSPEEMYEAMPGHHEALKRTLEIAERVDYGDLDLKTRHFPSFEPPEQKTPEIYLLELCEQGLRERFGGSIPPEAQERLEAELGTINQMGFASYFLIVWDFVRFARERGIAVGARGSACGALVSYALYLSNVDPIEYDLLFERFLDPNRSEAPDIDIDIDQDRRYEVIEYVRQKYGDDNVAQIGTFGTMAARAVLKDVGRTLRIPLVQVNQLVNLVPQKPNITLAEAFQQEPELKRLTDRDPQLSELLAIARPLEGLVRNVGTHAAGVVVANQPLIDLVPLQRINSKEKTRDKDLVVTQWNMGDVESAGLLKIDFLGLRNLTILEAAVRRINQQARDEPLDLLALPLDDAPTFELLQRGDTKGVFQLESAGIRDLLIKMKPDVFRDIIATNALYRPGPLNGGMVDAYINRKHGREQPDYEHPVMEEILAETHGVMVYQEQVMRIFNRLGGIELSKAYKTIKAISKKKTEIIAASREAFLQGSVERGLTQAKASKIFDLIVHFGGYGFNKSHSTAYALLAYQTAYLKAHYPTEFMSALLSSEVDGAEREKLTEHIDDSRRMSIQVHQPNINEGGPDFRVLEKGHIAFGLSAIKGVSAKAVTLLAQDREEQGSYTGLVDLFERLPATIVNQNIVETLIKAGALDCFGYRRAQLLAALPRAYQDGQRIQADRIRGQGNLFDAFEEAEDEASASARPLAMTMPDVEEDELQKLAEEKRVLGFYMSDHPLARRDAMIQAFATHSVLQLAEVESRREIVVGGMIGTLKFRNVSKSRSGLTRMAKFRFEDLTGSIDAMLWPEDFAKNEELVQEDRIVFLRGSIDRSREPAELVVTKIIPIEEGPAELARGVILRISKNRHQPRMIGQLASTVLRFGGTLDLFLEVTGIPGYTRIVYRACNQLKVRADSVFVDNVERLLGRGQVEFIGNDRARIPANPVPHGTSREDSPSGDVPATDLNLITH